jgi:uncharacterized protein YbjT (DUF2867 family)
VNGATIAITGGTGFVGKTLIRLAREAGYRVRALARSPQVEIDGVTWTAGALDQPKSLVELAKGSDAIIHVAGVVNAPDRAGFEAGNITGTLAMIEAARAAKVERFIHVSSLSVREPELSNYGWSKAKAESLVMASGLNWTMIRPPAIYGPGDKDMLDLFKMARWGFVTTPPEGNFSAIEVSDLSRLLLALIPAEQTRAMIYEADDGKEGGWSHTSYAKAIGWAVGKPVMAVAVPKFIMTVAAAGDRLFRGEGAKLTHDRVSYLCHPDWVISPLRRPPSEVWTPSVNTREGLKQTAAAYRAAGWL